jgi:acetyl-CoA carboxylase carboxyltransferase component
MGPKGAIEILEGKKIGEIPDAREKVKYAAEKEFEYKAKFANPYDAARYGFIDDVIEPRNTRFRIIRALQTLSTKKDSLPPKKHSNIPL